MMRRIRELEAQVDALARADDRRAPVEVVVGGRVAQAPERGTVAVDRSTRAIVEGALEEARDLVASGRPMAALRTYRERTGVGEAEAREAVRGIGLEPAGDG
ncbi:MAG: hypothetical protein M0P31_11480 [Solirubrobacteraceae bacterium]|nr:hypothetical protein [Solirubrobacteraceae bacterium]